MAIVGTILGDIIGSQYEFKKPKNFDYKTALLLTNKCRFTDDTVLTIATKYAIDNNIPFEKAYKKFAFLYPDVGYGAKFQEWVKSESSEPYGSYGNGSAMRISYIAEYYNDNKTVVNKTFRSAKCTHNHTEGIKGAAVTANCIWMAIHGYSKDDILSYGIQQYPKSNYAFSCEYNLDELREFYMWNETCQGSVPVVIRCVYEANNYTEFIRNVFSLNCDTDTLCAIGGGIAEELYDNTNDIVIQNANLILKKFLDKQLYNILTNSK